MLRLRAAASATEDFTEGSLAAGDPATTRVEQSAARRPVQRQGLLRPAGRPRRSAPAADESADDVALVRVEQLYPTPVDEVSEVLASLRRGPAATDIVWVQEEPANQGAWPHMELHLAEGLPDGVRLRRVSRRASASPAAGVAAVHEAEQAALIEAALGR